MEFPIFKKKKSKEKQKPSTFRLFHFKSNL